MTSSPPRMKQGSHICDTVCEALCKKACKCDGVGGGRKSSNLRDVIYEQSHRGEGLAFTFRQGLRAKCRGGCGGTQFVWGLSQHFPKIQINK